VKKVNRAGHGQRLGMTSSPPLGRRVGVATARRLYTRAPFRNTWGCLAGARGKAPYSGLVTKSVYS